MKLITRDTDYALRAVCFIARSKKEIVSVSELVKRLKIPRPFLRKILQVLNKKGLLRSYRGIGGGFSLSRKPDEIFLTGLMAIFQGPLKLNECTFKKEICPNKKKCILSRRIEAIERFVVSELKNITIESLLK